MKDQSKTKKSLIQELDAQKMRIAELEQLESEHKRNDQTLKLITDNMSDMIRLTNLQGINLYTSPSHEKVLGYKPEERVGKSAFDIVHPDDVGHIINVFSDGIHDGNGTTALPGDGWVAEGTIFAHGCTINAKSCYCDCSDLSVF